MSVCWQCQAKTCFGSSHVLPALPASTRLADAPELARPLLTDADRADDGNDVGRTSPDQSHSRRNLGQAAAPGSTKQWEAPNGGSQESPDMTVHLGV